MNEEVQAPVESQAPVEQAQPVSSEGATEQKPEATPSVEPRAQEQKEKNFRALREQNERIARERDEAIRQIEMLKQQAPTQASTGDIDFGSEPDAIVEVKHLSKVTQKIKQLEDQVRSYQQQSTTITTESRLRSEHADFDKVVTAENIKSLAAAYPELAASLDATPDLYNKAKSAYTLIKQFGINTQDAYQADREAAAKNAAKPRPLTSLSPQQGDSPLSHANAFANGLTDELKKQLYKEMLESRKNN
jgi:hypothetical protein